MGVVIEKGRSWNVSCPHAHLLASFWVLDNIRVVQKIKSLEFQKKRSSFPLCYVPIIGCVPIFRPIRKDLDPPNCTNIFQRNFSKNTKEKIWISVFCIFWKIFFLVTVLKTLGSIGMINTVLLIPILLCLTTFYFLWHLSKNAIKCHF